VSSRGVTGLRLALLALLIAAALCPCLAQAQEDDGWGEIVGLMNGLTAANQQLLGPGGLSLGTGAAAGGLSPGFLQGLARWSQTYAGVLQSIDGAFDENAQPSQYDPFAPNAPNPLWDQFNRWQSGQTNPATASQLNLRNTQQPRTRPFYGQHPRYR
jgi:hypothetical protein